MTVDMLDELNAKYLRAKAANLANKDKIVDLQEEVDRLQAENRKLKDKLYSASELDTYETWSQEKGRKLQAYIEAMAAAYYLETNLPPSAVVLKTTVMDDDDRSIYYWLEKRSPSMKSISEYTIDG